MGGGVEEPARRMREREGATEPHPRQSAARGGAVASRPPPPREGEREEGEGGTEVRGRRGREGWRRRRRVGGRRALAVAAAVAPARVGERRGERQKQRRREEGVRSWIEKRKLGYIFASLDSEEKRRM